ncbi:uncharacterized protein H6S33_002936 [Morchella sextelata]|uniref:uncharacterized protein n=1 Tax=Morchella sextelata TaxID=1174677 RepID=UPI001D03B717|nr:uncharacterized protein H6S33_002936 [Morchella sextelata]KAH0606948.1 hypothetical protein H6S33_002936 [Morchella sextelata]
MHYTTLLLATLSLTLTSAAVIPANGVPGGIPPAAVRNTNVAPATANFGTSLDHCMELLQAHNSAGNAAVPTVADASADITKCGRCLNTADLACGQKGYTRMDKISDRLMQCYVSFWPQSKCA